MNFELTNGYKIPAIGYGVFRMENDGATTECILEAIKVGYRHIDTAKIYGNEEAVGKAIAQCNVPREQLFITTKVWNQDMREDRTIEAFEESLVRLGLDYVDLLITHWPVDDKYISAYTKIEKLYKAGKVRAIGVSNCHIHHLQALEKVMTVPPMINQIELHPYLSQAELVEYCTSRNILVEAWSPLCANKNDLLSDPVIVEIGKKYNKSAAQVILRWDIERGILPLPKSATPSRIKENLEIFDFALTEAEISAINGLNQNQRVGSDPDNFDF